MEKINEIGQAYGFADDREAVVIRLTPVESAIWHGTGGAPMLAFELIGLFDDVTQERETEELETWKSKSDEAEAIDESA
mgnify:CR=1 FL=1